MRLVTWNINSLRLRMGLLGEIVQTLRPDVICLQEIKVDDPLFPLDDCRGLGFDHVLFKGMKSYNGVAILSKSPAQPVELPDWCGKGDCRHIAARIDGIEVHSLYVPAGGDVPDPDTNPKFAHKLAFLDELTAWLPTRTGAADRLVLAGDFNIAPLETDVWSHKQLLSVVSHTPVEVEKLGRLQDSLGWVDAVRHFIPPTERLYTWWSYRSPDWQKNDRGRRLDHVWVTPALQDGLRSALVARECRHWTQPSDHVPVLVEIDT
ncbi:exodeoxyribonuclease III [Magnetospirillum moscoviense]|uniref:Exodeoxyribonuclease III n=1 Tax=Magnetospirillum moscoviense TaxID=1437059 RepID=A0A178MN90_9PROT|nr:exodeoxyribonuclease III [Magnetospirillum moscoviense]OAN49568.1 exodeoxyribonuclease III [Magnetospirillum moscoviense]